MYRSAKRFIRQALALGTVVLSGVLTSGVSAPVEQVGSITGYPHGAVPAPEPAAADATVGTTVSTSQQAQAPEEVHWVDGELVAPLPKDPELRQAAIEQARVVAPTGRAPEVTYSAMPSGTVTEPDLPSQGERPETVTPYQPSERDLSTINLKIPDDFKLPPEVLAAMSRQGHLDETTRLQAKSSLAQALLQNFHGIDQTDLTPPDCDIAVNRNYVLVVVNASYAVYDKCGNLLKQDTFASLVNDGTNFIFDPKVLYDEWDDRWLISFAKRHDATQEAWITVVISANSVPMGVGNYWWYSYSWIGNGGYWGDYPDIGVDPDGVYITTNDFDWNFPHPAFHRARVTCLQKSQIYNSAGSTRADFFAMTNPGDATLAFALRPAEMKSWPGTYFLINSKPGGGSILTFWEITGGPATPSLAGYNILTSGYDNPPPMQQPNGTYVDCGDARLLGAKYYSSRLWAAMAERYNFDDTTDRSGIEVFIINTPGRSLQVESGGFGATGFYYAFPAVDFDPLGRGIVCFSRGGPTEYGGTRYVNYTEASGWGSSSLLVAGQSNKSDGNDGTFTNPYRWGDYYGCDLDIESDFRTMWFFGQFASDSPVGSWDTWIGAASYESAPLLDITPTSATTFVSTGLYGGPFTPPSINYSVQNIGGSAVGWTLDGLASWLSASSTSGTLGPSQNTVVTVSINSSANSLPVGLYNDIYQFTNCYTGGATGRGAQLTIGVDGSCEGAVSDLVPATPPPYTSTNPNQERGVFVTALKDFRVCSIGMKVDLQLPQTLTARIYAANGTTRGPLLASGTLTAVQPGDIIQYIPITYTLEACQEYDIAVEFGLTNSWDYWDDRPITPFDVDGVIRVRDGESGGYASNYALPYYSIQGTSPNAPETADLDPNQGTTTNSSTNSNQDRGIAFVPEKTINLSSFGWEADLQQIQVLTAKLYESSGLARGALLAQGTLRVTSPGLQWHDVPIDYVLDEGREYQLAIEFGITNSWPWWDETQLTEPYAVGAIRVLDAYGPGGIANFALPHYRASYDEPVSGAPFSLAKLTDVYPPPVSTNYPGHEYGLFTTSLIDQQAYSLGWLADVPEGQPITARVYSATGTTRGTLISEGQMLSAGPGMRWHDVPVAATLVSGQNYDLAILMPGVVNEWRWWSDLNGTPYEPYGVIRVLEGEQNGGASNTAILELRFHGCNPVATGIVDGPNHPPKFMLGVPYPNPVSTTARIDYSLDAAGPVTMTVYDVAGRRVGTIMRDERRPLGPGEVSFDSSRFATGVYFIKMQTQTKSVTRKITIVH